MADLSAAIEAGVVWLHAQNACPQIPPEARERVLHAYAKGVVEAALAALRAAGWVPPEAAQELQRELAEWHAECDKVFVPHDPAGLVRHHRGNAGFAAAGELMADGWVPPENVETITCAECKGTGKRFLDPGYESRFDPECRVCGGSGTLRIVKEAKGG